MPGNLLANSWSGLSEPDDAEEIWDQTSNFGLESSNDVDTVTLDISTPGYLLAAKLYICVISVVDPRAIFKCMAFKRRPDYPAHFLPLTIAHLDLANPLARQTY